MPHSIADRIGGIYLDEEPGCQGKYFQYGETTMIDCRGRFYDVHAKLQGPCVADLAEVFRDSLKEAGYLVKNGLMNLGRLCL